MPVLLVWRTKMNPSTNILGRYFAVDRPRWPYFRRRKAHFPARPQQKCQHIGIFATAMCNLNIKNQVGASILDVKINSSLKTSSDLNNRLIIIRRRTRRRRRRRRNTINFRWTKLESELPLFQNHKIRNIIHIMSSTYISWRQVDVQNE